MKQITLFLIIMAIIGCKGPGTNSYFESAEARAEKARQDSIVLADSLVSIQMEMNRLIGGKSRESFLDTTGSYLSPVKVVRASTFQEEYSSYYSIRLTFRNMTKKTIQAIRFEWYGENAFGEPADMGGISISGYGNGFTDEALRPGVSRTSVWSILSRDGKKVIGARAYEVAFTDGTKWERKK